MRFCPFCAQENPDDSRECVHCGKRLPAARTPPPRPVAPPREKPAPKVAARPAPRSLPKPSDSQLAVDPPTTQTTLPAERPRTLTPPPPVAAAPTPERPRTLTPPPPERPRTLTPPPPERGRTPTPPPLSSPLFSPTPLPPPVAPAPEKDRPASLPAPLPPPPGKSPTGTVLGMAPPTQADSERRNTAPLPLQALEVPSSRGEPSLPGLRDDLPTTPHERVDDDDLANSDDGHTVPDLFSMGRPARDDSLTLPKPRKAVVTRLESARRPVDPLPEKIDAPDDKPSITYKSSEESAPPILDPSNTPYMPTLALPPMPAGPTPPNIFGSVKYLLPLIRAMVARKRAQRSIRQLLHDDQHLLDQVLKDLGRTAREHDLDVPAISDEMRKVKAEEQRRARAEADSAKADDDSGREDARWNADEAERKTDITGREFELKNTEDELRQKGEERRGHEAERARIDGQIRAAEKRSQQALGQAQKAEVTPPEKGGGPNTAANLRMQAAEAQKEATSLIAPRDEAKAKAEALDAPIHALTQKIVDMRSALAQKRKELADAAAQHKKTLAALEAEKQRAAKERSEAEREMSQRFVNVGTMLNLHRVEDGPYKSLYARIDELKGGLNAREATIVRLETELRTYDRRALQTGLITVGAVFFLLVLLGILLLVLLSR